MSADSLVLSPVTGRLAPVTRASMHSKAVFLAATMAVTANRRTDHSSRHTVPSSHIHRLCGLEMTWKFQLRRLKSKMIGDLPKARSC